MNQTAAVTAPPATSIVLNRQAVLSGLRHTHSKEEILLVPPLLHEELRPERRSLSADPCLFNSKLEWSLKKPLLLAVCNQQDGSIRESEQLDDAPVLLTAISRCYSTLRRRCNEGTTLEGRNQTAKAISLLQETGENSHRITGVVSTIAMGMKEPSETNEIFKTMAPFFNRLTTEASLKILRIPEATNEAHQEAALLVAKVLLRGATRKTGRDPQVLQAAMRSLAEQSNAILEGITDEYRVKTLKLIDAQISGRKAYLEKRGTLLNEGKVFEARHWMFALHGA